MLKTAFCQPQLLLLYFNSCHIDRSSPDGKKDIVFHSSTCVIQKYPFFSDLVSTIFCNLGTSFCQLCVCVCLWVVYYKVSKSVEVLCYHQKSGFTFTRCRARLKVRTQLNFPTKTQALNSLKQLFARSTRTTRGSCKLCPPLCVRANSPLIYEHSSTTCFKKSRQIKSNSSNQIV